MKSLAICLLGTVSKLPYRLRKQECDHTFLTITYADSPLMDERLKLYSGRHEQQSQDS